MSSIGDKDIDDTIGTLDPKIDGLLDAFRWSGYGQKVMRFAITTSDENYEDTRDGLIEDYPDGVHEDIERMPAALVEAVLRNGREFEKILTFNFENDQNAQNGARVRYGFGSFENADDEDSRDAPAFAYTPSEETFLDDTRNWVSGDVFLNKDELGASNGKVGSLAYIAILHETGHAMGLKHGHEEIEFEDGFVRAALPMEWDSQEFTVMTYRSFIGGPADGVSNPEGNHAQTLMMLDILALQSQYGADFSTEKKNTVYSWDEKDGSYFIDGEKQWTPMLNKVFMTIWDGNGSDTYDLSNYKTNLSVDLNPGGFIDFKSQKAQLGEKDGNAVFARGNVFNALLFDDDTRSLIEHAKTGSGNDKVLGNVAWNRLDGGDGNDTLSGGDGDDTLTGGDGQDDIDGGAGIDYAGYTAAKGVDVRIQRVGPAEDGVWSVTGFIGAKNDDLRGIEGFVFGAGKDFIEIKGAPEIDIFAGAGDDTIQGGGADAMLVGGRGTDTVVVSGESAFQAFGGDVTADGESIGQKSQNDVLRIDLAFGDDEGFFLAVIDPTKLSEFSDFAGSTAEGFTRIDFRGQDGADSVDGGVGNDTMRGADGDDRLTGYGGDDDLFGGGDDDGLSGGAGDDKIAGDDGDDRIDGEDGNDTLTGGDGEDEIYGGAGDDLITTGGGGDFIAEGEEGNDTITGAEDAETFFGDEGNDQLSGAGGKDILQGGAGNDTIDGGAGDDTLQGDDGEDRFIFGQDYGAETLNDFDALTRGGQDRIDLRAFGFDDFRDFENSVSITGSATIEIKFGKDDVLKLFDVSKSDLDADDFLF